MPSQKVIKTTIPHCYIWMSRGNKKLFIGYVRGYVKSSHPGYQLKDIKGMTAICERTEVKGDESNG